VFAFFFLLLPILVFSVVFSLVPTASLRATDSIVGQIRTKAEKLLMTSIKKFEELKSSPKYAGDAKWSFVF
jgi:hypothetical protein